MSNLKRLLGLTLVGVVLAVVALAAAQPGGLPPGASVGGPINTTQPFQRDPLIDTVYLLSELNFTPDFTLDKAQKTKIQALREEFKKKAEDFRNEHKDQIKQIQDKMRAAWSSGDQKTGGDLQKQMADLMGQGPKSDEYAGKIKDVLTADQLQQLNAKIKARDLEQKARWDEMRKQMQERQGGHEGSGGGGPGGAPQPPPNPKPN